MGVTVHGIDEFIADLEALPETSAKAFRQVVSRGGVQIKQDWKKRWEAIRSPRTHIPHLIRGIGYDLSETGSTFTATVGVIDTNRQAFLAEIIENGTLTSAPHPGGPPALEAELPRMAAAAEKVAADLLEGR